MKTLLLAPYPPCPRFTGTIMTEALCRFLPPGSVACYATCRDIPADLTIPPGLEPMPLRYGPVPLDSTLSISGGRFKPLTLAQTVRNRVYAYKRVVEDAVRFGREHGVDRVWAILQGGLLIHLCTRVAQGLGVPLYTQVWDYPEYWISLSKLDKISTKFVLRDYNEAMTQSACVAAASQEMADEVTTKYGTRSVPIVGALDKSMARGGPQDQRAGRTNPGEFIIGMAGQLYAAGAWGALLRALDAADWRIAGRDVRVRYLGYNQPIPDAFIATRTKRACIEYLGYRPQSEVVDALSDCDALYVPFFSGEIFELLARTSFPAKVATYFAAGRPVLFHGPAYAPAARFIKDTNAGVVCDSLDSDQIIAALNDLAGDPNTYEQRRANAHRAFLEHLTLDAMQRNLEAFLGEQPAAGKAPPPQTDRVGIAPAEAHGTQGVETPARDITDPAPAGGRA